MPAESIGNTDADTLISIAVAVGMIIAVGLTVLAVERFRPRKKIGAALVDLATGERVLLPAVDGETVALDGAAIRYGDGRYYVQAVGTGHALSLQGRPVEAARLVNGDQLTIDGVVWQFRQ